MRTTFRLEPARRASPAAVALAILLAAAGCSSPERPLEQLAPPELVGELGDPARVYLPVDDEHGNAAPADVEEPALVAIDARPLRAPFDGTTVRVGADCRLLYTLPRVPVRRVVMALFAVGPAETDADALAGAPLEVATVASRDGRIFRRVFEVDAADAPWNDYDEARFIVSVLLELENGQLAWRRVRAVARRWALEPAKPSAEPPPDDPDGDHD